MDMKKRIIERLKSDWKTQLSKNDIQKDIIINTFIALITESERGWDTGIKEELTD